jgi:hypothetical protein
MRIALLLFVFTIVTQCHYFAQLEKVIVEKYYITDSLDATDITGGGIEKGTVTYRIYVDLAKGSKLRKIYGDNSHTLKINSTLPFFNNQADGQTFAKDFMRARYGENTVALDTWLTLGQTTKKQGNITYFGVLKNQDNNGSFIGGVNNDGGSAQLSQGLLLNDTSELGIPLTIADGMDTMTNVPQNWFDYGFKDLVTGTDTTIFGSVVSGISFESNNCTLSNDGVNGVIADSNQIIVAQLTTKGALSFELNIEIEAVINGDTSIIKYVARDTLLTSGTEYSPYLKYPFTCGCDDPDFLEYNSQYSCYLDGSCKTPIVYGCMDTMACNYDPKVNFQISSLCCYPGACNDRDIAYVCPQQLGNSYEIEVYPNPSQDVTSLDITMGQKQIVSYKLYNPYGNLLLEKSFNAESLIINEKINLSNLEKGMYHMVITIGSAEEHRVILRN